MSIRVTHGMARVEIDSLDWQAGGRLTTGAIYATDDLIEACRRALEAADDARASVLYDLLHATEGNLA